MTLGRLVFIVCGLVLVSCASPRGTAPSSGSEPQAIRVEWSAPRDIGIEYEPGKNQLLWRRECEAEGTRVEVMTTAWNGPFDNVLRFDERVVSPEPRVTFSLPLNPPTPLGCAHDAVYYGHPIGGVVIAYTVDGDEFWRRALPLFVPLSLDPPENLQEFANRRNNSMVYSVTPSRSGSAIIVSYTANRSKYLAVFTRHGDLVSIHGPRAFEVVEVLENGWKLRWGTMEMIATLMESKDVAGSGK